MYHSAQKQIFKTRHACKSFIFINTEVLQRNIMHFKQNETKQNKKKHFKSSYSLVLLGTSRKLNAIME